MSTPDILELRTVSGRRSFRCEVVERHSDGSLYVVTRHGIARDEVAELKRIGVVESASDPTQVYQAENLVVTVRKDKTFPLVDVRMVLRPKLGDWSTVQRAREAATEAAQPDPK